MREREESVSDYNYINMKMIMRLLFYANKIYDVFVCDYNKTLVYPILFMTFHIKT